MMGNLLFAVEHIPPDVSSHHGPADERNCRGYAVGRAFGNNSWSSGTCPLNTLQLGEVAETWFDKLDWTDKAEPLPYVLANVRVGDIILWNNGSHAAYVTQVGYLAPNSVTNVKIDQVRSTGSERDLGKTLEFAIDKQGRDPDGIARKKTGLFHDKAVNSFGSGQIKIASTWGNSPVTIATTYNQHPSLDAVDDGESRDGYVRLFQNWWCTVYWHDNSRN
jgi:hypothetical protein